MANSRHFKQINKNHSDDKFNGWPTRTLLEAGEIPIAQIAELALREGQSSNPLYRVHRWFARRVGSQFRSIITALTLSPDKSDTFWDTYLGKTSVHGAVVIDPFIGGGTSLVESMRCNARVIGFDIDPVATYITRFELVASRMENHYPEIDQVCSEVAQLIAPLHRTIVDGVERDVLHHFWVQVQQCSNCQSDVELHPHFQLAYSKEKSLQWAFCKECHEVYELPIERKVLHCSCGKSTTISAGTYNNGIMTCPICKHTQKIAANDLEGAESPIWRLFAQEYLVGTGKNCTRLFKRVEDADQALYESATRKLRMIGNGLLVPTRSIPCEGRSDGRPLIHGIRHYADFFNDRQKLHLHLLGSAINQVESDEARRYLQLAFSEHLTTNCMYTAYAFGYRRTSPMFSIHSYRHITRPVELNPWQDGVGRGTFINTVRKISKAIMFAKAPQEMHPDGTRVAYNDDFTHKQVCLGSVDDVLNGSANAAIETQSSEKLYLLPDSSVDLVLTDPPYFDNLSYSELSDFYLAWHQALGIAPPPYDDNVTSAPILQNLAITRRSDEAIKGYQERLQKILVECNRVLKPDGICVFTYHHKLASAWEALGTALLHSGLSVTKVLPMRGEGQGGLHTYDGTIKWDAVLVCRKKQSVIMSGIPVISETAIKDAFSEAKYHFEALSAHKRIGFKIPDFTNLARALIVSKAFLGEGNTSTRPMSDALRNIQTQGEL
ncbi:MAG: DNA methyltransferase [Candidatus Cloacimonetes bacterium]|nr:DNA methyltransferase [Candidatus Cloacimonadota bacterium]